MKIPTSASTWPSQHNYAWANPVTGMREQTETADDQEMLREARWRVWNELQDQSTVEDWQFFKQCRAGRVTVNGPEVEILHQCECFAWCDPITGQRKSDTQFPNLELVAQLKELQQAKDAVNEVIVYAQWPAETIRKWDPMPPQWEPESAPAASPEDDDIETRKEELAQFSWDDSQKIALQTAWALLDIAQSLRGLSDTLATREVREGKRRNTSRFTRLLRFFRIGGTDSRNNP